MLQVSRHVDPAGSVSQSFPSTQREAQATTEQTVLGPNDFGHNARRSYTSLPVTLSRNTNI